MPAKWFYCPDGQEIEVNKCLEPKGCRMQSRCATLPYLRLVGFDRTFRGVSPSSAGNGARQIWLKATIEYVVNPADRVWVSIGTGTHGKLSFYKYIDNVLSEEALSDEVMQGIPDVLEQDEENEGSYILYDYKVWGSFKIAKAIGLTITKTDKLVLDSEGKPILLKSGGNKGKPKTVQEKKITIEPDKADLGSEELQLNRYRIFFESKGFPISKMMVQAISRDGGTYIAEGRGIDKKLYLIPIKRLQDDEVLAYYQKLSGKVKKGFETGYIDKCGIRETWGGRRCTVQFCEVLEACMALDK